MSFQEKSVALMTAIVVVVYGWYFVLVLNDLDGADIGGFPYQGYQGPLLVTVFALVGLAIVGHILIAVIPPYEGDKSDERDKVINVKGEYFGGFALATFAVVALGLAMIEAEYFWIANVILLGLVFSEVISGVARLAMYRRMR